MSGLTDDEVRELTCDCAESMTGMDQCPYHGGNDEMWVDVPARAIQLRVEAIIDTRVAAERERLLAVLTDAANAWDTRALVAEADGDISWADGVASRVSMLRALIAEERAR